MNRHHLQSVSVEKFFAEIHLSSSEMHNEPKRQFPPVGAAYLLYFFYKRQTREAIMGDLEEDFYESVELFGYRAAAILY